jgi:hypothetical protein
MKRTSNGIGRSIGFEALPLPLLEHNIYNQTRDVFLHYKLPFDSEPPEE